MRQLAIAQYPGFLELRHRDDSSRWIILGHGIWLAILPNNSPAGYIVADLQRDLQNHSQNSGLWMGYGWDTDGIWNPQSQPLKISPGIGI